MTAAPTGGTNARCPVCQGELIDGRVALPIVGSLRFVYRLGTMEVATEVLARMCTDCGHVALRARDPDLIRRAQQASSRAGRTQRWALRNHGRRQAQ
jgi:hypothetical protein